MKSKKGFLIQDALFSISVTTVLCLMSVSYVQIEWKKSQLLLEYEQNTNELWHVTYSSLKECDACSIPFEEEMEDENDQSAFIDDDSEPVFSYDADVDAASDQY